jgi:enterochelin esterase family protein
VLALATISGQQPPSSPPAAAPQPPPAGRGGGRGGPPLVTPEVKADKTVTFRFRAPNAQQVTLIGELDGKTYPMTKDESGVWSVTIGPLAPDVYNYQFNVDGVIAMDPVNPAVKLGFGAFPPANMFEIPGDEFDDAKNVPHGTVRIETYHSKTMGVPRTIWVYTPPGYESGNTRYPVFYLLHGSGNTKIREQVPAIGDLNCMGRTRCRSFDVIVTTIAANHLNSWVGLEPLFERLG